MYKDGNEVTLTKDEAILLHRDMWNWIADKYKEKTYDNIFVGNLKEEYLKKYGYEDVKGDCFCCEYSVVKGKDNDACDCCEFCPVLWLHGCCVMDDDSGDYDIIYKKSYDLDYFHDSEYDSEFDSDRLYKECEMLSRKIANLPERKGDK